MTCMCMQVHARVMRTTVELTDKQRAKLLELAAERGQKGFSAIVQEALDQYVEREAFRRDRVQRALATLGTLTGREAARLEQVVRDVRGSWR